MWLILLDPTPVIHKQQMFMVYFSLSCLLCEQLSVLYTVPFSGPQVSSQTWDFPVLIPRPWCTVFGCGSRLVAVFIQACSCLGVPLVQAYGLCQRKFRGT